MEQKKPQGAVAEYFAELEDPRWYNRRPKLLDLLVIAICAAICGADGWGDVELFGKMREKWLREMLELPNGIPSDDTFRRVFAALDAEQFQNCFMSWIEAVEGLTEGQVIAADGKALRRSHDRSLGKKALYMVSAWASASGLVLGQRKVDDKTNEITAIPDLLNALDISGCIVPWMPFTVRRKRSRLSSRRKQTTCCRSKRISPSFSNLCRLCSKTRQKCTGSSVITIAPSTKAMGALRFENAGVLRISIT